jgi:hypothetical protein
VPDLLAAEVVLFSCKVHVGPRQYDV